jgi:hypothetical protein
MGFWVFEWLAINQKRNQDLPRQKGLKKVGARKSFVGGHRTRGIIAKQSPARRIVRPPKGTEGYVLIVLYPVSSGRLSTETLHYTTLIRRPVPSATASDPDGLVAPHVRLLVPFALG